MITLVLKIILLAIASLVTAEIIWKICCKIKKNKVDKEAVEKYLCKFEKRIKIIDGWQKANPDSDLNHKSIKLIVEEAIGIGDFLYLFYPEYVKNNIKFKDQHEILLIVTRLIT